MLFFYFVDNELKKGHAMYLFLISSIVYECMHIGRECACVDKRVCAFELNVN